MAHIANQKGFTLVEGLLTIISLALLSGVGLYAYNSIKDNQTAQAIHTEEANAQKSKASTKKAVPTAEYQEFSDLGIKIKKADSIQDFTYATDAEFPKSYTVHSERYNVAYEHCYDSTETSGFGAFARDEGKYNEDSALGSMLIKQFPKFYISASWPNGLTNCTNKKYQQEFDTVRGEVQNALRSALDTVELL